MREHWREGGAGRTLFFRGLRLQVGFDEVAAVAHFFVGGEGLELGLDLGVAFGGGSFHGTARKKSDQKRRGCETGGAPPAGLGGAMRQFFTPANYLPLADSWVHEILSVFSLLSVRLRDS